MYLVCPACSKRLQIPDDKLPTDQAVRLTCPACQERFAYDPRVHRSVGVTHAQLGDGTQALKWLARAEQTGLPCYPWYERDPLLQPMRKDNEFQRFMAELKKSWESAKARHAE